MVNDAVFRRAAPLALAAILGGCALPPPSGCISTPPPSQALVELPAEVMGEARRRVRYADPKEFDEYVLYRGPDGGRLEAVYLETRFKHGNNVVLVFDEPLAGRVQGFAYNAGLRPEYGEDVRIATAFGGVWAKPFRHPVTGQACAGFIESWDNRADDPHFRPSKAIYGYYCAPAGDAAAPVAPEAVISRLEAGLRPVSAGVAGPGCADAGIRSTQPEGAAMLDRAKPSGAPGSEAAAGHADFPPVKAIRFRDNDGDSDDFET